MGFAKYQENVVSRYINDNRDEGYGYIVRGVKANKPIIENKQKEKIYGT